MAAKKPSKPDTATGTPAKPACEHAWEIMEGSTAGMSEGQAADYMAGMWRNAYCPKCHGLKVVEGDFGGEDYYDDDDL